MKPVTSDEFQFLYALLLDNTQVTVRQGAQAHDIMQRIAMQLDTKGKPDNATDHPET